MVQSDLDNIAYNKFANGEITLAEYIKYKNRDKIMEKKEAMKILKDFRDKSALFSVRTALDTIIPELKEPKESEDEKISKEIIYFLSRNTFQLGEDIDKYKSWLAWLENQSEKTNPYSGISFEYNGHIWGMCARDNGVDILLDKQLFKHLEKQADQKTLGKVEPKFHEGDWVVYNNDICQIVKREEGCNKLVTVFGIEKELVNERNLSTARLWTIQDAKDGDILVTIDDKRPFLYKGCLDPKHPESPVAYCGIDSKGYFCTSRSAHWWTDEKVQPAAKEQRDTLFTKMKEAGYKWNTKTKELKKIESKTLNANKVIAWINEQTYMGWIEDIEVDKFIEKFKKEFEL